MSAAAMERRMGECIKTARGEVTQVELGRRLAPFLGGADVPQTTISRWESGQVSLELRQVVAIERALGVAAGTLLAACGAAPASFESLDVESVLIADTTLTPAIKDQMLGIYRAAVRISREAPVADTQDVLLTDPNLDPSDARTLTDLYLKLRRKQDAASTRADDDGAAGALTGANA